MGRPLCRFEDRQGGWGYRIRGLCGRVEFERAYEAQGARARESGRRTVVAPEAIERGPCRSSLLLCRTLSPFPSRALFPLPTSLLPRIAVCSLQDPALLVSLSRSSFPSTRSFPSFPPFPSFSSFPSTPRRAPPFSWTPRHSVAPCLPPPHLSATPSTLAATSNPSALAGTQKPRCAPHHLSLRPPRRFYPRRPPAHPPRHQLNRSLLPRHPLPRRPVSLALGRRVPPSPSSLGHPTKLLDLYVRSVARGASEEGAGCERPGETGAGVQQPAAPTPGALVAAGAGPERGERGRGGRLRRECVVGEGVRGGGGVETRARAGGGRKRGRAEEREEECRGRRGGGPQSGGGLESLRGGEQSCNLGAEVAEAAEGSTIAGVIEKLHKASQFACDCSNAGTVSAAA